jgi:hypothetical protein
MNIVKQLELLKLKGWTWRGDVNVARPVPRLLFKGTEQERMETQEEADQTILSRIEGIDTSALTWETLQSVQRKWAFAGSMGVSACSERTRWRRNRV